MMRVRDSEWHNNKKFIRTINEFVLDKYYYHSKQIFNMVNVNNFPEIIIKRELENVVVELLVQVFGKKQEKEISLKTPKTWFNWMKIKYRTYKWMKWVINRYPIKYNYHHFKVSKVTSFPNLKIPYNFKNKLSIVYHDFENENPKIIH